MSTTDNLKFNFLIPSLSSGSHTLTVFANDSANNQDFETVTFSVNSGSSSSSSGNSGNSGGSGGSGSGTGGAGTSYNATNAPNPPPFDNSAPNQTVGESQVILPEQEGSLVMMLFICLILILVISIVILIVLIIKKLTPISMLPG